MCNQLTSKIKGHYRCERCDRPLNSSLWKGVVVVLSLSNRKQQNNLNCIRCIKSSKGNRYRTDEQLDSFVNSLMVVS